ALLTSFDGLRREFDAGGALAGADRFTQQAFNILTSSRLAEALDLDREDPRLRDRYGRGSSEPAGYGDAGPLLNDYSRGTLSRAAVPPAMKTPPPSPLPPWPVMPPKRLLLPSPPRAWLYWIVLASTVSAPPE